MPHSPATVLVIDDEPAIRRFLKSTLEHQGWAMVEATDADEATRAVRHHRPRSSSSTWACRTATALLRGAQAPVRRHRHPGADQSRRRAQQGGGPGRRCRRLCHQAVQHPRAPGPDAHSTPPRVQEQGGRPAVQAGELIIDLVHRHRPGRRGDQALAQGMGHPGAAGAPRRPRGHPRPDLAKVWGRATRPSSNICASTCASSARSSSPNPTARAGW